MIIKLCQSDDIVDPGSKEFNVKLGRKSLALFVVHKNGSFYAYENSCPHTSASLNWQEDQFLDPDHNLIQCSVHDALFEIDSGYCISGPCSGQTLTELELSIKDNEIFLVS